MGSMLYSLFPVEALVAIATVAVGMMFGLLIVLMFRVKQRVRSGERRCRSMLRAIGSVSQEGKLEEWLLNVLKTVAEIVIAEHYSFYIYEPTKAKYQLRALWRRDHGQAQIEVGYGRLMAHGPEGYMPPFTLDTGDVPEKATASGGGENSLVTIPVGQELGAIILGLTTAPNPRELAWVETLSGAVQGPLRLMLAMDRLIAQNRAAQDPHQVAQTHSPALTPTRGSMEAILGLLIRLLHATGGMVVAQEGKRLEMVASLGLNEPQQEQLGSDPIAFWPLMELATKDGARVIGPEDSVYGRLPMALVAIAEQAVVVSIPAKRFEAAALIWHQRPTALEGQQLLAARPLAQRLGELLDSQIGLLTNAKRYLGLHQNLVMMVDNQAPHTVGHCQLIARYALAMAKTMHLGEQECYDIQVAGMLHDLGMLGLGQGLLGKLGRYTALEYSTMTRHSAMGAAMIEQLTGNDQAASYVRHHHERWDGRGYPDGLVGPAVPIGARIIACADLLVAKLTGRRYRDSLSFAEALGQLRAASGSQLDPQVVEALFRWYESKRSTAARSRSLAPCWVMRCSPEAICSSCPAYKRMDRNCWQIEGVNCAAHGNQCSTCMVYTEVIARSVDGQVTP